MFHPLPDSVVNNFRKESSVAAHAANCGNMTYSQSMVDINIGVIFEEIKTDNEDEIGSLIKEISKDS